MNFLFIAVGISLRRLFALHSPILEPNLNLALGEVEVAGQLPALLFRDVGVEEELLLQLQRLELGVGLALLAHRHVVRGVGRWRARPVEPDAGGVGVEERGVVVENGGVMMMVVVNGGGQCITLRETKSEKMKMAKNETDERN